MANSYQEALGDGSTTQFSWAGIDGYTSLSHIKVTLDGVPQVSPGNYTLNELTRIATFTTAPGSGALIRIERQTPNTAAGRAVDFNNTSVLDAEDMDRAWLQLLFLIQELSEGGGTGIARDPADGKWNAEDVVIKRVGEPLAASDAATRGYVDSIALYGTPTPPQRWSFVGNGSQTDFVLTSPLPAQTVSDMFFVIYGGVLQVPETDYTVVGEGTLHFTFVPDNGVEITVRNIGIGRIVGGGSISTALLEDGAVTTPKLATSAVTEGKLANGSVSYVKLKETGFTSARNSKSILTINTSGNLALEELATILSAQSVTSFAPPTAAFSVGGQRIVNVAAPSAGSDAVNKAYVDAQVQGLPAGTVVDYASLTPPGGWLLCNGQAVSRATYANLFAIIGTTFGIGDGSSTFNVPDCRGRVRAGHDSMGTSASLRLTLATAQGVQGNSIGNSGGHQTHTLLTAETQAHNHSVTSFSASKLTKGTHLGGDDYPVSKEDVILPWSVLDLETSITPDFGGKYWSVTETAATPSTATAGSNAAHNNCQPTMVFAAIIKY